MSRFFLLLFCLSSLSAWSLGRLIQPDGTIEPLGEEGSGASRTVLLSPDAIPRQSWILLPPGTVVNDVELVSTKGRRLVAFPVVRIPGLRYALEVPARTLSMTIRGRFAGNLDLVRSLAPPSREGQPWVVRSNSELRIDLPTWKIAEGWTGYLRLTRPTTSPWTVTVVGRSESLTFTLSPSVRNWDYAPTAWQVTPASIVVRGADPRLSEVTIGAVSAQEPLPADPSTLLAWPETRWRKAEREWFHWAGTSVLVLVTRDYRTQDDYLKRLAFYVEKAGFRGTIVEPEEVAHLHAWNAHDYAAPDLARFFNQVADQNKTLNPAEQELLEWLAAKGILVPSTAGLWKPGVGALVGISTESPPALRQVLFVHEAFHGLYFTTGTFREGVQAIWKTLSEPARAAFREYLARSRYDANDEGLMINEFQAYVLQRPPQDWEGFLRSRVLAEGSLGARLTWLGEYLSAAYALDTLVRDLFGLASGEVSLVKVSSGT